ncbi:MAG: type II toxin-antitoxin system Phd/YefM family antitoxin [Candidatus Limnocylindrales bacterium]
MATEIVNVHAAKTNLSRLLERVEAGQDVVIGRAGKPIARLVPYVDVPRRRWFGAMKDEIRILPGFDESDADIQRDFDESLARPLEP